jgi:hypothetical protein
MEGLIVYNPQKPWRAVMYTNGKGAYTQFLFPNSNIIKRYKLSLQQMQNHVATVEGLEDGVWGLGLGEIRNTQIRMSWKREGSKNKDKK